MHDPETDPAAVGVASPSGISLSQDRWGCGVPPARRPARSAAQRLGSLARPCRCRCRRRNKGAPAPPPAAPKGRRARRGRAGRGGRARETQGGADAARRSPAAALRRCAQPGLLCPTFRSGARRKQSPPSRPAPCAALAPQRARLGATAEGRSSWHTPLDERLLDLSILTRRPHWPHLKRSETRPARPLDAGRGKEAASRWGVDTEVGPGPVRRLRRNFREPLVRSDWLRVARVGLSRGVVGGVALPIGPKALHSGREADCARRKWLEAVRPPGWDGGGRRLIERKSSWGRATNRASQSSWTRACLGHGTDALATLAYPGFLKARSSAIQ
ncbi:cytosolic Fe-S cluster assembly factor NUBP2 isoform X1 [Pseudorca crassidens]|uniref:cytosolic Fe-S cluster assembly factor NUBP2 isoform X1 n=1 Tax=Pseudorca crassidens TaxID=82174 RepID=UPI00352E689B